MPAIEIEDKVVKFQVKDGVISFGESQIEFKVLDAVNGRLLVKVGDAVREIVYSEDAEGVEIFSNGAPSKFKVLSDRGLKLREFQSDRSGHHLRSEVRAPMPGLVVKVMVKKGDTIKRGSTLAILEAMKMENEIRAPQDADVTDVLVKDGDIVEKDQVILTLQ